MDVELFIKNPPLLIFGVVVSLASLAACAVFIRHWRKRGGFWEEENAPILALRWLEFLLIFGFLVFNYFVAPPLLPLIGLIVAAWAIASTGRTPAHFWALQWKKVPDYLTTGAKLLLLVVLPLYLVSFLSSVFLEWLGLEASLQPTVNRLFQTQREGEMILGVVEAFLISPLWEEIVFRGFLYPALKAKAGRWIALGVTSLLFAAIHFHLPTFAPLFLFGAILTLVYEHKGSLGYPMALHGLFNGLSALLIFWMKNG
ncbi:MAG: type II CAAX endopeptidase family protein [bacterium]